MILSVVLLIIAGWALWLSSRIVIESLEKIFHRSTLSKITLSLLVIGVATSIPEIAITANALSLNAHQVAVGSLIGSQVFLLFLVIPFFALFSNGFSVNLEMKNRLIGLTLLLAGIPMVALLDQQISRSEAGILLIVYAVFIFYFFKRQQWWERIVTVINQPFKVSSGREIVKVLLAIAVVLIASNSMVRHIIELAAWLETPRFLVSLLLVPVATNLPELSLFLSNATRSHNASLGDYLGSITINSLLLAVLAFIHPEILSIGQNISAVIVLFILGLGVFWWCCSSRQQLTKKEAVFLLIVYLSLIATASWEIMKVFVS